MGLAMPGRADDGAGRLIPGLAHLTGICVLPQLQGTGIGGQLLDYLLDEMKVTGSSQLRV
jgi:ribosomal protein S18 acetylase RimI-like enzyme